MSALEWQLLLSCEGGKSIVAPWLVSKGSTPLQSSIWPFMLVVIGFGRQNTSTAPSPQLNAQWIRLHTLQLLVCYEVWTCCSCLNLPGPGRKEHIWKFVYPLRTTSALVLILFTQDTFPWPLSFQWWSMWWSNYVWIIQQTRSNSSIDLARCFWPSPTRVLGDPITSGPL